MLKDIESWLAASGQFLTEYWRPLSVVALVMLAGLGVWRLYKSHQAQRYRKPDWSLTNDNRPQ